MTHSLVDATWAEVEAVLNEVYDVVEGKRASVTPARLAGRLEWYNRVSKAVKTDIGVGELLEEKLKAWIDAAVATRVAGPVLAMAELHDDSNALCKLVTTAYGQYKHCLRFGAVVFHSLGKNSVIKRGSHDTVEQMFLKAFNRAVYSKVKRAMVSVVLTQVNTYRDGTRVDIEALASSAHIFSEVGTAFARDDRGQSDVYEVDFERHYLASLATAYRQRAAAHMEQAGGHFTYLAWAESRFERELALAKKILRHSSVAKVERALEDELLKPFATELITHPESGFERLLEDHLDKDIQRMFRLMRRVPTGPTRVVAGPKKTTDGEGNKKKKEEPAHWALSLMADGMKKAVESEVNDAFETYSSTVSHSVDHLDVDKPCVDAVLELDRKYRRYTTEWFQGHPLFAEARRKGLGEALSTENVKRKVAKPNKEDEVITQLVAFASMLTGYFDDILGPHADADTVDGLIDLFECLTNKDIFEASYRNKMGKRLLQGGYDEDVEREMMNRLAAKGPSNFTRKMNGMLKDLEATKAHLANFANGEADVSRRGELLAQVWAKGNWPGYTEDKLAPPPVLASALTEFVDYYKDLQPMRRLVWINSLGTATFTVSFQRGVKEISGSLYQAAVLLALDDAGVLTARELMTRLNLEATSLKPHIGPMLFKKATQLLVKVDEGGKPIASAEKRMDDNDRLMINDKFTAAKRKINLPSALQGKAEKKDKDGGDDGPASPKRPEGAASPPPQAVAAEEVVEKGSVEKEIESQRQAMIDCAVVRTMKARKTLPYPELRDAVIMQLAKWFPAQPKMIKARVDDLMAKQYLHRDEEDRTLLHYIA